MATHNDPTITLTSSGAEVRWSGGGGPHVLVLDLVVGAHPRWVGSAADLDEMADRRTASRVIDVLVDFGEQRAETVALYHDDGRLEWLVEPETTDPGGGSSGPRSGTW